MRMTSPEKLILENQMEIMAALSLLCRAKGTDETMAARQLSTRCSKTSVALHAAKTWPEEM